MSLKILVLHPHEPETPQDPVSIEEVREADIIIGSQGQTLKDLTVGGAYSTIRSLALRVADYQFVRLGRKIEPLVLPASLAEEVNDLFGAGGHAIRGWDLR